jgi:hypothetical protein
VIRRDGEIDREVQINERGTRRFLPPAGPHWKVKTSETKGEQVILDDSFHHLNATGHFRNANEFTSDFHYDSENLVANLEEEDRQVFRDEIKIPDPLEKEIGTSNQIEFFKKQSFFTVEYYYTEIFQIRWLMPILLHDTKKEIIRGETAPSATGAVSGEPKTETSSLSLESSMSDPEQIDALAREKLNREILSKFQFHSEVSLPGKIQNTNANTSHGSTAVWNFKASDFSKDGIYRLHAVSKASSKGGILGVVLLVLIGVVILAFSIRQREKVRKKKS